MHNNIMAAGSKDRPPMLGPGRYSQWRSRFLRYIDTKGNGEYLRKCIFEGPYKLTSVVIESVAATVNSPEVPQHDEAETVQNMSVKNKLYFQAEKEATFLLLTGIGDEIYSTVDACNTANEMWIAIERLQQERSRFVMVVKQSKEIDTISYHTLFDILKQYQNEVNDIRTERIAKSANPLALLAAAQPYSDNYYQAQKPQRSNATSNSQINHSSLKINEAKVKHDIDVIETINIELEHKVAKLLKENETLKRHYKEMFDSIKTTRAKNIEHTTSLIANNDKFKAQLQEKGFAIAALKNELRKLTGNSVNTKFAKPSILGKPVLQPHRNQFVVRQPTAFKSERPKISKERFASQVDVPSNKTTTRNKPIEQIVEKSSASKKPERQILTGHRFSNKKTTTVPEKTMNPRSCLRWQLTGRILKTVGLRWVPTGKLFNSCTSKVESEPTHGSNVDIHHIHACKQTLGLSAGTSFNGQKQQRIDLNADALYNEKQENLRVWLLKLLISKKPVPECSGLVLHQMTSDHNRSELGIQDHSNEQSSSKLVPKVVP
ncbi:hypothetical protein Tco_0230819 [Tanacetum coccineum]